LHSWGWVEKSFALGLLIKQPKQQETFIAMLAKIAFTMQQGAGE